MMKVLLSFTEDGRANVKALHDELFPLADTKSASAQLSTLLKAIGAAADTAGIALRSAYTGSKQAGAAQRHLVFYGPGPSLREDAEGLNALPPERVMTGQTGALLGGISTVVLLTFNEHEYAAVRKAFWPGAQKPPRRQDGGIDVDDLGEQGGLRILHCHSGQGNRAAQLTSSDVIAAYVPRALIAVGIAFGADEAKQGLADVLVSSFLCDYEKWLVRNGQIKLRGPRPPGAPRRRTALEHKTMLLEGHDRCPVVPGQYGQAVSLKRMAEAAQPDAPADAPADTPGFVVFDDLLAWLRDPQGKPIYALLGEYGMGKTIHCQRLARHLRERRADGEAWPEPIYFDLRKVENVFAATAAGSGKVPTLKETIADCLRHGYLHDEGEPGYDDVLAAIDRGALVIFDGLDEVLSRIGEAQGLRFTANLLKVLPEAAARRPAIALRVLVSCRTQFFRTLAEQNAHLAGEHRGAQPAERYRAVVLLGFRDEQIVEYLKAVLPASDPHTLLAQIESVHNLRELAGRPFTLKLVAEFIPHIAAWRAAGRRVTGVTLYREVVRQWLIRDKEKQSFQPEDKELLAADLAAQLWRQGQRGLAARALEAWLGRWLAAQDPTAKFQTKPRDLLEEDLRNSTFLKRSDEKEGSRFEFAHTSLYEFFLADHLYRALSDTGIDDDTARARWAGPPVSVETLDFLGQMLAETDSTQTLGRLARWRAPYLAQASELLFSYIQRAHWYGWPLVSLAGIDLQGANLEALHLGSWSEESSKAVLPLLDLRAANLSGANLRRSRFWSVNLTDARLANARLSQAEFIGCHLKQVDWQGADLAGASLRNCVLDADADALPPAAQQIRCVGGLPSPAATLAKQLRLQAPLGHGGPVNGCAFSPDGRRVLSASCDRTLRLWDAESGACLRVLAGHQGGVNACAFSADGRRVLSASFDRTLRLWDAESGAPLRGLLHAPSGAAAWDIPSSRLLYASGSAWRYLGWLGEKDGEPAAWPLELGPPELMPPELGPPAGAAGGATSGEVFAE